MTKDKKTHELQRRKVTKKILTSLLCPGHSNKKYTTSNPTSTATARLLVEVLAGEITANNLKTKKRTV